MSKQFDIKQDLIKKYDYFAPRYTSYPTMTQLRSAFDENDYKHHAKVSNASLLPKNLSLYVHIPFCHSPCFFCGNNKLISQASDTKVNAYLDELMLEIVMRSRLFNSDRIVKQIHFGGCTPNFLSVKKLSEILDEIASCFHLDLPNNVDIGIEIDPQNINTNDIAELASIGFTRFSIGVQDLCAQVQKAIHRKHTETDTLAIINAALQVSQHVNVDLIVGLPSQTVKGFELTLDKIIETGVSRITVVNFAYLPERTKTQRMLQASTLPDPEIRLEIVRVTRDKDRKSVV